MAPSESSGLNERFAARNRDRQERLAQLLAPAAVEALPQIAHWFDDCPEVLALFSMGSAGTLGHGLDSDFDLWVIVRPETTPTLQTRADELVRFGRNLALDLRPFFVDPQRFIKPVRREVSGDDCGSLQNTLLLDEFYRTAIHWAGASPAWWQINPSADSVTLGNADQVPADEILGATLWQLSKAMESPQKALLKLILLEAYAVEGGPTLAAELHAALRRGDPFSDPYAHLYARVERYLKARGDLDRLQWVRLALYRKTGIRLSERPDGDTWQAQELRSLVTSWGWDPDHLAWLDRRETSGDSLLQEHQELARQLDQSHHLLRQLADSASPNNSAQEGVELLQARIAARALSWPGKVPALNHHLRRQLSRLQLMLDQDERSWLLKDQSGKCLLRDESSVALVTWCLANDLPAPAIEHLDESVQQQLELDRTAVQTLLESIPPEVALNWAVPAKDIAELWLMTRQENTLERVVVNSWGEISTQAFAGLSQLSMFATRRDPPRVRIQALAEQRSRQTALAALLRTNSMQPPVSDSAAPAPRRRVFCFDPGYLVIEPNEVREFRHREQLLTHIAAHPLVTDFEGAAHEFAVYSELQRRWRHAALTTGREPVRYVAMAAIHRHELFFVDRDGVMGYRPLLERAQPYLHRNLRALLANAARRLAIHVSVLAVNDGQLTPLHTAIYLPHPLRAIVRDIGPNSRIDVEWNRQLYRDIHQDQRTREALRHSVLSIREAASEPYPISVTDVVVASPQHHTLRELLALSQRIETWLND